MITRTLTKPPYFGTIAPINLFLETLMANTAQAKKRIRQAEKHRVHNTSQRSEMRTHLKKALAAIETASTEAQATIKEAMSVLDRMVARGAIHINKAARHKSRLNARLKKKTAK
jgi:small subunit ribosomal protein S20